MFPNNHSFIAGLLDRYFNRYGMTNSNTAAALKIISRLDRLYENGILTFDESERATDCVCEFIAEVDW